MITGTADIDALEGEAWREQTIDRTPNPKCPACKEKRIHGADEWDAYHPHSRTGVQRY